MIDNRQSVEWSAARICEVWRPRINIAKRSACVTFSVTSNASIKMTRETVKLVKRIGVAKVWEVDHGSKSTAEPVASQAEATHELRKRHGLLATGLIMGLAWSVLHVPLWAGTASGAFPPALNVAVIVFFWLLPYRVLMVCGSTTVPRACSRRYRGCRPRR
jgi:hypothetical protein